MAKVQMNWLGPPVIEREDHLLRLEMRKTLALLAYVSLSSPSPTRETLANLFWPEFDQQHALANLRRNLYSLASSLPPDLLAIDRDHIGLRKGEGVQVDVDVFCGLLARATAHSHPAEPVCLECRSLREEAVAMYRGDFLQGFNLKNCPEFDEWQFYQREELRATYAGVLERLAGDYQATGEWEKAIAHTRSWLALDRLHEPAQRMLMRLYFLSGQRSAAIRQYEACVQLLEEELGQPPEPETQTLYREMSSSAQRETQSREEAGLRKEASGISSTPLLKTKLFLPKVPRAHLHRPRLVARLNQCVAFPLTLVSASAGFGKTTLLAGWAEQARQSVAWIALDTDDNDVSRLMRYIIHALKTLFPASHFGDEALHLLQAKTPAPPADILASLINELATLQKPVFLVLDDFHVIHSSPAREGIQYLLDHCPPSLHLILSSRTEPSLSLARMRVNGQMAEIHTDDLRFSLEEAQQFLTQLLGFPFSAQDLASLADKTEGWIAGIQMTAIAIQANPSLQTTSDVRGFLRAFKGSQRYILDYLIEEVLERQPEAIRSFLLQTSILDTLCADLCDEVRSEPERLSSSQLGSAEQLVPTTQVVPAQHVLEFLERNNLFLIPLDDEAARGAGGGWYRYHHLFRDLLHSRLRHTDPRREAVLHRNAAVWYADHSYASAAIRHALAAGDGELAGNFIEKYAGAYIARNEISTVLDWIHTLPVQIAHQRPWILLYQTWILARLGQMDQVEHSLQEAERLLASEIVKAETGSIQEFITMIRAYQANLSGHSELAMQLALGDVVNPPDPITPQNYNVYFQLGYARTSQGDIHAADRIFQQVAKAAEAADDLYTAIIAQVELGDNRLIRGKLLQAETLYLQTLDWLQSKISDPAMLDSILKASLAAIAYEKNDLTTAARLAEESIASAIAGKRTNTLAYALTIQAYGYLAQAKASPDNISKARAAIEQAVNHLQSHRTYPRTASQVQTCLVNLWLAEGKVNEAYLWAQQELPSLPDFLPFAKELEHIAIAQVHLARQAWFEAFTLLEKLAAQAMHGERHGRLVKIHMLQALACQGMGNMDEAFSYLARSLALAQAEGFLRTYLEVGARLEDLLRLGKEQGIWQTLGFSPFTDTLLEAF